MTSKLQNIRNTSSPACPFFFFVHSERRFTPAIDLTAAIYKNGHNLDYLVGIVCSQSIIVPTVKVQEANHVPNKLAAGGKHGAG